MIKGLSEKPHQFTRAHASSHNEKNASVNGHLDNSNNAVSQREIIQGIDNSPVMALQRQQLEGSFGQSIQRVEEDELMQGKFEPAQRVEEEELMQGKFEPVQRVEEEELMQGKFEPVQRVEEDELMQGKFEPVQKVENKTGLPDNLKSGMENLSGLSLDHVKVNYNSSKPAAVQAHAYAQGSDIHLASGQEKHLPHELGHVVQQMEGRVSPTTSVGGMAVNDNAGLENEATQMGDKALSLGK